MNTLRIDRLDAVLAEITKNGFGRFGAMSNNESRSIICAFLGLSGDIDASSVIRQIQVRADEVGKLAEVQRRLVSQSWSGSVIEWDIGEGYAISIVSEPLPSGRRSWNIVLRAVNEKTQYDVILGAVSKEGTNTTFRVMNVATKSERTQSPEVNMDEVIVQNGSAMILNECIDGTELVRKSDNVAVWSFLFKPSEVESVFAIKDVTRKDLTECKSPKAFERLFSKLEDLGDAPVPGEETKEATPPEAPAEEVPEPAPETPADDGDEHDDNEDAGETMDNPEETQDEPVVSEPEPPKEEPKIIVEKGWFIGVGKEDPNKDTVMVFRPNSTPKFVELLGIGLDCEGRTLYVAKDITSTSDWGECVFDITNQIQEARTCHGPMTMLNLPDVHLEDDQRCSKVVIYNSEVVGLMVWRQKSDLEIVTEFLVGGKVKLTDIDHMIDGAGTHPSIEVIASVISRMITGLADDKDWDYDDIGETIERIRKGDVYELTDMVVDDQNVLTGKLTWKQKETPKMKDIDQPEPEPIGEVPANKPEINTVMSAEEFLRKLFGTTRPTILHVLSKLEKYGKTADIFKLTGNYPTIQDIVYQDYTFSIVRMKNGSFYRIFVAHTIMDDLQGSCWEQSHDKPGRWFKIADVTDPKVSAIENQRKMF